MSEPQKGLPSCDFKVGDVLVATGLNAPNYKPEKGRVGTVVCVDLDAITQHLTFKWNDGGPNTCHLNLPGRFVLKPKNEWSDSLELE